jgi:predicted  nucleic acid-binding Zn-ribbon protein
MVTTDTTQINRECNSWRENLRSYRNELGQLRDQLTDMARNQNDKEVLTEVEHYHNQFYIQQINIHDLKQAIKQHDRKLQLEAGLSENHISSEIFSEHEQLHQQYTDLENTISELRQDFHHFRARS